MPKPLKGNGRYMAGLDGLRAVAVLSVIAYHLHLGWAPGGLLGVGMFFVLSGYLITDLLIAEWSRNGRIDLKDFWIRRARRLLPAMFIMLAIVGMWTMLADRSMLPSLRKDMMAAVLYVSNWWFIFHQVSYFESFGPPSPLGHLWSLAVEEQFYLLWPLLIAVGLRFITRRGPLVIMTLGLAALSAVAMAWLYVPGTDPSRIYYGTDTRAFALLIGAALAIIWPSRKLTNNIAPKALFILDLAGSLGLVFVLLAILQSNQYEDFLYEGGMVLVSIATALVVATLAHPASRLGKLMSVKPLRWLGVRSYGIYLWHYPVIVMTSPVSNADGISYTLVIIQVMATILLSAISWRLIEEPIRHGALGKIWSQIKSRQWRRHKITYSLGVASVSALLLFCGLSINADKFFPVATASSTGSVQPEISDHQEHQLIVAKKDSKPSEQPDHPIAETIKSETNRTGQKSPSKPIPPSSNKTNPQSIPKNVGTPKPISGQGVTAIGDSVMVDIAPELTKLMPGIVIDGKIGRQFNQAQAIVDQLKSEGKLGSRVIIELGTNGAFTDKQLISLIQSLDGVEQIILVNTRVPRPWEEVVNTTLANVASTFPNTTLVDWYSASAGKGAYFYPDGVHLNPDGSLAYASLLAKAVKPEASKEKTAP
ncbi:acyltransferase family protein [Brevibacillus ginsengisoli]|uniref:acyltransferase family protein n=1 Tax=Brevibacillus ginsengisoli TaxID=363854 RepID=UPI003CF16A33